MKRHELSDKSLDMIKKLFKKQSKTGRRPKDDRVMLNGVLWLLRTGAPWRDVGMLTKMTINLHEDEDARDRCQAQARASPLAARRMARCLLRRDTGHRDSHGRDAPPRRGQRAPAGRLPQAPSPRSEATRSSRR